MNQWHQMTWEEVGKLVDSNMDAALLPIGATEQHGPHLGCGMDTEIAHQLGLKVAENTQIALLPTLPYGCSIGHSRRWPGTIALQPKTMIDVIKEIGDWVYASGFKRLFLLNSHVSNFAPLRCALEMLRAEHDDFMVAIINSASISERVKQRHFEDADDWHANEAETSLMMAVAPELVREDRLKDSDDPDRTEECVFSHPVNRTSLNGVTGKPSLASVEKGEELFAWMVEDLSGVVTKGMQEEPPLAHGYFEKVKS
ncbi:creatininase family protein [Thiomicrorhabdus sp. ZW0627]|uniref:creatininase family protein n=1 Tax=Thiomicrorhabdus sp. ZW0627 TaxID=3039774 RepID=UPI002436929C|nr:creatininase family protein [Thiomicrorhabdus sp. ZW0627]MDG6773669.1 creatininase family protein [Thiomicrorhabdus sp. ZW0627]